VLPFIIGGLVLLLVAGGVGLYFLLKDDEPTPVATTTSQSTEPTEDTSSPTEDTEPTEETDIERPTGDGTNFAVSELIAITFVDLMAEGEYESALLTLCDGGQERFPDGQALADDFFGFLGAQTVTGNQTTDVHIDPDDADRDIVELDIETEVGIVPMAVSIFEENGNLTICGYKTP